MKVSQTLLEDTIRTNLEQEFPDASIELAVDGNRCLIRLVSAEFDGVMRVRREQRIYGCLKELLATGELHAVTIQAKTPAEAEVG
ncbi:MAG: BolA/IbaG family iron-sulfur metabolism protein [Gammaproteobacteria bacterium]|nr:BolA/IbaG family iron-sulfur metabolism protein [Gammaproteobacteria bacterium]